MWKAASSCACVLVTMRLVPLAAQQAVPPDPCGAAARPSFDVVSVKPAKPNSNFSISDTADGLSVTSPLLQLIEMAYSLRNFQVMGGPGWLSTTGWEVRGKADAPEADLSKLSDAEREALRGKHMQQLQSVLVDRFQLQCHMTLKELPVYELVLANGGSKLKPSTAEGPSRGNLGASIRPGGTGHAVGIGVSAERIAAFLSGPAGRLVVDKTGLAGAYDLTLDWIQETGMGGGTDADASAGPTLFTAVEEQMGLSLRPAKATVPIMAIDHVDQPADN